MGFNLGISASKGSQKHPSSRSCPNSSFGFAIVTMTSLTSLPTEIIQLIFAELQDVTSGPRYALVPPQIDIIQTRIKERPKDAKLEDLYASWKLSDPGPLGLAYTCKAFQEIYLSDSVAGNLILEIPDPKFPAPEFSWAKGWGERQSRPPVPISAEDLSYPMNSYTARGIPYEWWRLTEHHGNLLSKLKRMKEAPSRKTITRFMLDSRWEATKYNNYSTNSTMLGEIFIEVGEVFGDELMVVICSQGVDVQKDFRAHAPWNIKQLERLGLNLRIPATTRAFTRLKEKASPAYALRRTTSRTHSINLRNRRNPKRPRPSHAKPSTKEELSASAPLSLHLYFGYEQSYAGFTMGDIIKAFANKHLETIYLCSDPNNLNLVGHSRRPAEGGALYLPTISHGSMNPWRFLLPSLSSAHETLKNMTLDCSLFWSEIAYVLPHLHKLESLNCYLTLIHTEPVYPMELEGKEAACLRVLDTCLNSDINKQEERALKKNQGKKWIQIAKENIVLPAIEPVVKQIPIGQPHSRWHTVDMKTCMQFMKGLMRRARRDDALN